MHFRYRALIVLCLTSVTGGGCNWQSGRSSNPARDAREVKEILDGVVSQLEANRAAEAALVLDDLLLRNPGEPQALLYRGQAARMLGDPDAAVRWWSQIPDESRPQAGMARFLEGNVAVERQRAQDAERLWREAARLHPRFTKSHERLMDLYVRQLRTEEIREQLRAIRAVRTWTPIEHVLYRMASGVIENPEKSIPLLQSYLDSDPSDLASRRGLVRYLLAAHRPSEVAEVAEAAPVEQRIDSQLRAARIEAALDLEDSAQCARLLREWQRPDRPDDVQWWRAWGLACFATNRWEDAAAAWRFVTSRQPESDVLYRYGQALTRLGRLDEAKAVLDRAHLQEQVFQEAQRIMYGDLRKTDLALPIVLEIGRELEQLREWEEAAWWYELAAEWDRQSSSIAASVARCRQLAAHTITVIEVPIPAWPSTPFVAPVDRLDRSGASESAIRLVDEGAALGLDFIFDTGHSPLSLLLESVGGGVAVLDYDRDGWPDFFFPQGGPVPRREGAVAPVDALFQQRNGRFMNVAKPAGVASPQYGQGAAAGDWNNDGFDDLAVGNYGTIELYLNCGDGTFDRASLQEQPTAQWSASLGWGDLDRDGDLDLFVVNYLKDAEKVCRDPSGRPRTCNPENYEAEPDLLFENLGDGRFRDVTAEAGIADRDGKGLGVVIADFDDDGWPDIFVSNDGTPNHLYHNLGTTAGMSGRFEEVGLLAGAALSGRGTAQAGMGIACADLLGNQRLDLYLTTFYDDANTLFENEGGMTFRDVTEHARLAAPTRKLLGFGTQAIDFDLDGAAELLIANGHIGDFRDQGIPWTMRPQLFANRQNGAFEEVLSAGAYFSGSYLGRGVAACDWNRDGKPDAVIVHQDQPVALLTNATQGGRALILELVGTRSNRSAIGARISVKSSNQVSRADRLGGWGFLASNDSRVLIGIGADAAADIRIEWPSGSITELREVVATRPILIHEDDSRRFLLDFDATNEHPSGRSPR